MPTLTPATVSSLTSAPASSGSSSATPAGASSLSAAPAGAGSLSVTVDDFERASLGPNWFAENIKISAGELVTGPVLTGGDAWWKRLVSGDFELRVTQGALPVSGIGWDLLIQPVHSWVGGDANSTTDMYDLEYDTAHNLKFWRQLSQVWTTPGPSVGVTAQLGDVWVVRKTGTLIESLFVRAGVTTPVHSFTDAAIPGPYYLGIVFPNLEGGFRDFTVSVAGRASTTPLTLNPA